MNDRSDSIVFFTLIDFLAQLLFFGVLLFVWNLGAGDDKKPNKVIEKFRDPIYVPVLEGVGPFIHEKNVELLTRLFKTIKSDAELRALVEALQAMPPAKLNEFVERAKIHGKDPSDSEVWKTILSGFGRPPCIQDGWKRPIMELTAFDDRIVVSQIFEDGKEAVSRLAPEFRPGTVLERSRIADSLRKFRNNQCNYYIQYTRNTDSEHIRRQVEQGLVIINR
jgi:hypothetical protein